MTWMVVSGSWEGTASEGRVQVQVDNDSQGHQLTFIPLAVIPLAESLASFQGFPDHRRGGSQAEMPAPPATRHLAIAKSLRPKALVAGPAEVAWGETFVNSPTCTRCLLIFCNSISTSPAQPSPAQVCLYRNSTKPEQCSKGIL